MKRPRSLLAERLAETATSRRDHVALLEPDGAYTFGELWAEVERRTHDLSKRGEDRTLLLLNRNHAEWLVSFVAALNAGWRVAVADAKLPPEQEATLSSTVSAAALLRGDALAFVGEPRATRSADATPAAPLVYFTSGSTGMPKGVLLSEETVLANVSWNTDLLGLARDDVLALVLPLSHSYNLVFALSALLGGSTLVLERDLSDLKGSVARLSAAGVTVLQNVPTSLRTLVERGDLEQFPLSAVRTVRVGAGVLTDELARKTFAAFPGASIVATYGMTELGLVAARTWTASPIEESTFDRFVPDLRLDVLSAGPGEEGEIQVDHPLLFGGYVEGGKSPDLRSGAHITGDLGCWLRPGVLELRSRKKAIAKVAGVLVNLEDVARVAATAPGVADSGAISLPHPVFGETVHVFVARAAGCEPDPSWVARITMEQTALRTAPRVHVLDRLPRTDSGKLARAALLTLARAAAAAVE